MRDAILEVIALRACLMQVEGSVLYFANAVTDSNGSFPVWYAKHSRYGCVAPLLEDGEKRSHVHERQHS